MAILLEKQDFSDIYDLLEASFPHSEFREREAQAALFDKAPYRVYGLREGEKLLALCALWELPGWRYLEHLAVAPEARNGGLGGRFLDGLTADRPCVLEVELPETDLARRRIGFYRRHGFAWNDYAYMQPALRSTESPIPLRLMTRNAPLPEAEFHRLKEEIYRTVYGVE